MKDSDGESPTTLTALIMESGAFSEPSSQTETKNPQSLNDVRCRIFAFIGGEEPHFMFAGENGEFGRFYVSNQQIALCTEEGIKHINALILSGAGK